MAFSFYKTKQLRVIFLVYWVLLSYIIAALVWWFIALNQQNRQMTSFEVSQLKRDDFQYEERLEKIEALEKRKMAQYIGEGSIFLLLILSGAVFIYRAVWRQFKMGREQQHFMMAITHELKTPIAVTRLNLETLQKRKLGEAQQQRLIQNTLQEANRLNTLCNNMLLASQIEAGGHSITTEEVNLASLLDECVHDFETRYPDRSFRKELETEIYINGDLLMLQMAVNNLLDNATKYSPRDSPITVRLYRKGRHILLSVLDEGRGIDAEEKKKIFDKFYRVGDAATRAAKGTGLGLFLSKKIVTEHRADISVTDNTPGGSNFTIEFEQ